MKVNIRDLFDDLNPEEYRDIEIKNISIGIPSLESVKRQVFEDINKELNLKNVKGKRKSKGFFRRAWVAAIIVLAIGTTVFAFSRPEFFKWIFGEDVKISEENIQDIVATASNKDIIFTVESILSDGNQNYFVISLENKNGEKMGNILPIISIRTEKLDGMGLMRMESEKIAGPDDLKSKGYYIFEVNSNRDLMGKDAKLILHGLRDKNSGKKTMFNKELEVSFNIGDNNANNIKTVVIENPQVINDRYYVTEIKVTNLGINLKGEEVGDLSGVPIPRPKVDLKYKDGKIRNISQYKTSQTPDVDFPNGSHAYSRGPDKKEFTNTFKFGEIVDIDDLEAIIIDGKKYKISK
ncbi:MAG: DUF4179 domain-containing protein [Tissierellia bacterium]|nr:DUF4179 domain-containing protein [Tissierellia bacterium]